MSNSKKRLEVRPSDHYFRYDGKPIFLLASTEHYGSVINREFDFHSYLKEIANKGLNLSRVFTFYRETWGCQVGYNNTLTPRPEAYLCPWQRTGPGIAHDGLPRFDLDKWEPEFFERLKEFLTVAAQSDIIVELSLFSNPYDDLIWKLYPLHPDNNVNGVGKDVEHPYDFMSKKDTKLLEYQEKFVTKVTEELRGLGNVYYEVCNEPLGQQALKKTWQQHFAALIKQLNPQSIVGINCFEEQGGAEKVTFDESYVEDPSIDFINYHHMSNETLDCCYFRDGIGYRFGSIRQFTRLRRNFGKPILFDEDWAGIYMRQAPQPDQKRMEAWECLLCGVAGYDHEDSSFTPSDGTGKGKGTIPLYVKAEWMNGESLREQLSFLASFARGLDLSRMTSHSGLIESLPLMTDAVAMSHREATRHVIYIVDARGFFGFGERYGASELKGPVYLNSVGQCTSVKFIDVKTNQKLAAGKVEYHQGKAMIVVPPFRKDLLIDVT